MSLSGHMELELVQAVGEVVAGVAPQLNGIGHIEEFELPLIGRAALFDVVDVVETLQVLVSLTVELEVGLQVGLVRAELADEVAGDHDRDLMLPELGPVLGQVLGQELHGITAKILAHTTAEEVAWVGISCFLRRLQRLWWSLLFRLR